MNDLIEGTVYQDRLVKYKENHERDPEKRKKVGYKYWLNFKKRNAHKIVTKRGEKFELD